MKLLETKGLSKKFGGYTALQDVNLSLDCGKIVGLLGPNGSGKTTLLKLINDLLVPTEGTIHIDGNPPGKETKKIVSYLPERTYLTPSWKVSDLISYFEDFYEDFRRDRAEQMMEALGIGLHARLRTLSKGTREKVQLVMVMSRKAQLYILDEPIAGVDPAARDYILHTIMANYDHQSSILLSTHLISDIESILDEVIFIRYGQAIMHAPAEAVRRAHGKSVDAYFREVFAC